MVRTNDSDLLNGDPPIQEKPRLTIERILYTMFIVPLAFMYLCAASAYHEFVSGEEGSLLDLIGFRIRGKSGLVQRSASKTAVMVAVVRYIGSFEGWSNDKLSRHFVPYEVVNTINFAKVFEPKYPLSLKKFGLLCTRTVVGDRLFLNSKPKQAILLGAGLDTRFHRLTFPDDCKFFEVDIATTQNMKKMVAAAHDDEFTNKDVNYVAVDFSKELFTDKLNEARGFDANCPDTTILFEGVSMYLSWPALEKTMRLISETFANGTLVGMDVVDDYFTTKQARKRKDKVRLAGLLLRIVSAVGEPFQWGLPVGKTPSDVFGPLGFEIVHEIKADDVEQRFLCAQGDSVPFAKVPHFWHYLVLKVNKSRMLSD